ncbi:MAG: S8 family serine peptidase [Rudaea sp.]|uniref:S8 family serine peptidase n=1 Tax=Rudaea sp. TaxID=2136325 RepID=UPI0039E4C726
MISNFIRPGFLAAAIAACLATTAAAQAGPVTARAKGANSAASVAGKTYIVMFSEPSVALRNRALRAGKAGDAAPRAAIPFARDASGHAYLDTRSEVARSYRSSLIAAQTQHKREIEKTIGRTVAFSRTYQYAINGAAVTLSEREAAKLRSLPGVAAVVPSRTIYPSDDVTSRFIGADQLWRGSGRRAPAPGFTYPTLDSLFGDLDGASGVKGDGVVIGVIDTGYNSESPSFQATDASGYTVTNKLGSGNYLGDCGVAGISFGGCNDKVIGVYDEYSRGQGEDGVNVEDTNGHGSHTASTAGGNARSGEVYALDANLAGIAPHANLAIFSITAPGSGSASDASELGAIEDAIDDHVVQVINLSFGGCYEPNYWDDPVALGFLAAQDANIFVALSAGNTQAASTCPRQAAQTAGTLGNALPWVTTVAATTPPATDADVKFSVTGPGTPPAALQAISPVEGTYDTPLTPDSPLPSTTPIVLSPEFDAGDAGSADAPDHGADGCDGYPAGAFKNSIALASRGTCTFAVKVSNAIAAGAVAVVISDNRVEGGFSPTVGPPVLGVPVFSVSQAQGLALQAFLDANGGKGTAGLGYPSSRLPMQGDVLADFSLLGPVLTPVPFDVIKPDIAAPGVGTLAAYRNATVTDGQIVADDDPDGVAFLSGTSMASPHIAGAAALLVQAHPDWSAAEIKSALMMTATTAVTKADGVTAADPYDVGSGRVQVNNAAAAGLVLDETLDNFYAGDPTQGGDASTFNLASLQNFHCAGSCSFTRTFRNTQSMAVAWTASVSGDLAAKVAVSPATFTVAAGATVTLTFTVNAKGLASGGTYSTGTVRLWPSSSLPGYQPLPDLHLPIAVAVPAASVTTATNVVDIDLRGKASASATLDFANTGGGTMAFSPKSDGVASLVWADQKDNEGYYYFTSTHYLDAGEGDLDQFLADDFVVSGSGVDLATIAVPGAAVNPLSSFGASLPLHWRIYADDNGLPGSTAVWSYDSTAGGAGVSVSGDTISLDLTAAGQSTALAAGRYWLSVYPDLPCNDQGDGYGCTEGWNWDASWYGNGTNWAYISSAEGDAWANDGTNWYGPGLAMTITTQAACGAVPSWLTLTPNAGTGVVSGPTPTTLTFSAASAGYAPDTSASTYVCFGTSYRDEATLGQIPASSFAIEVNAKN